MASRIAWVFAGSVIAPSAIIAAGVAVIQSIDSKDLAASGLAITFLIAGALGIATIIRSRLFAFVGLFVASGIYAMALVAAWFFTVIGVSCYFGDCL